MSRPPRLSLGPPTYYWPRATVLDYYQRACDWPVDIVYLGETVCSRRKELRLADWVDIATDVSRAGKEAVLSTYELIETEADLRLMRSVVENGRFRVEANDMGAVKLLAGHGPFVAGPFLNVYNAATLSLLAELGADRWVAPVELAAAGLQALLAEAPDVQTEVFAYGRLPLAVSARCFTARYYNLSKDHCEFRCLDHPDGLLLATRDDEPFLSINGVQTQSARIHSLLPHIDECAAMGIDILRLSPQLQGMAEVVAAFDGAVHGRLAIGEACAALGKAMPAPSCNGYWHGRPGMADIHEGMA